jgi:hypothetical protein
MRKHTAFAALVLALLPLGVAALEAPDAIRGNWGVLVESLLNPALNSNVSSPSINFNFGAGVSMPFSPDSRISFGPSADIYFYNGEFNGGQPVAADESNSTTYVVGCLLNAPVVYSLPINPKLTLSAGMGLCLDLRFALASSGDTSSDASKSNAYFWGMGRFITPSTTLRLEYTLTERVGFGFSGRILWPIYNLWTGEGYGFFDQTKYLLDIVIRFRLRAASPQALAEPSASPADSPAPAPAPAPAPTPEPAASP